MGFFDDIITKVQDMVGGAGDAAQSLGDNIPTDIQDAAGSVTDATQGAGEGAADAAGQAVEKGKELTGQ